MDAAHLLSLSGSGVAGSRSGRPWATPIQGGFTTSVHSVGRSCARLSDKDLRTAGSHYHPINGKSPHLLECETAICPYACAYAITEWQELRFIKKCVTK